MKKNYLKIYFILPLLLCFLSPSLCAKAPDYYQGKGRIALSSDGNMHDNDDHYATKMTLMILAKAGMQPHTVLYTHSDHVWGSENNDLDKMKEAAEETGRRFGFNDCQFMAAVEDSTAAFEAMAKQIHRSTAEDPLFIVAAGPMHVVGRGLELANKVNPESLAHVTIISHSDWNDKHADHYATGAPHGPENPHSGWTWAEMVKAFGDRVNFNHISDQNGTPDENGNPYKNKDKFAAPTPAAWYWMRDHQDPNINWVFQSKLIPAHGDYSDAGIAYYLVADLNGERGDQMGNPVKLQQWIGEDVIPVEVDDTKVWSITINVKECTLKQVGDTKQLVATVLPETALNKSVTWTSSHPTVASVNEQGLVTALAKGQTTISATSVDGGKIVKCSVFVGEVEAGEVTVGEDFIAFEAESTQSDLGENWVVLKAGDEGYEGILGELPAFGGSYIQTTQGKPDGLGITAGTDMLQYKFTPYTSGNYKLSGRMAQRLDIEAGTKWDQCNDIFIKMEGDFASGTVATPVAILQKWNKFYGRGHKDAKQGSWGAFCKIDVNHSKYDAIYALKAGQEYTFSIAARSKGIVIDYFLLSKSPIVATEQKDLATNNPEYMRPGSDVSFVHEVLKAPDFTILTSAQGTQIPANEFAVAKLDWKNKNWLSVVDRLKWGASEMIYQGKDEEEVNVFLESVLEVDGESCYKVFVNNVQVGKTHINESIWSENATENYILKTYKLNEDEIAIKEGDTIRVEFQSATNGKVPEIVDGVTLTATSRARWQSVVITTQEDLSEEEEDQGEETPQPPVLVSHNAPTVVNINDEKWVFDITYTSNAVVDLAITVHNMTDQVTSGIAFVRKNGLPAGVNQQVSVDVPYTSDLLLDKEYKWSVYFMPRGGNWQNQYAATNIPFFTTDTGETTSLGQTNAAQLRITTSSGCIQVTSSEAKIISVYTLTGNLVCSTRIQAGECREVASQLPRGVYLVNRHKVLVP